MSQDYSFGIPQSFLAPVDAGRIARPDAFVQIDSLEDFRAQIRPESGIHFFDHGRLTVCRYTLAIPDVFQTAFDLETRGLIFETLTGKLLSRPLHKFFNLGEREGLGDIDFGAGWRLEEKLDGSMIGAFVLGGEVIFHTRGGVSDQAKSARAIAGRNHLALTRAAVEMGATPVFEWTAPENRVVISYERSELTLLALRDIATGAYFDPRPLAIAHGVACAAPLAEGITSGQEFLDLYADLVARTDIEGAILVDPNGHRLKVKTADYLKRHKILANLSNERWAYQAWLDDVIDDTAAALGGGRARTLKDFEAAIEARISELDAEISAIVAAFDFPDRKSAAAHIQQSYQGVIQALVFGRLAGTSVRDRLRQILGMRVASPEKRAALKDELGLPNWQPILMGGD